MLGSVMDRYTADPMNPEAQARAAGQMGMLGLSGNQIQQTMNPYMQPQQDPTTLQKNFEYYQGLPAQQQGQFMDYKSGGQGVGRFKDMNTYASQLTSLSSDAQKALAPFDQAMLGYKQITNMYKKNTREGGAIKDLEGPFDLALQRNFIKSLSVLRPEAYMQDDAVQAMMAAQNIGDFAQLKNWLTGDIKLNEKGRKRMLKAYDSVMKDNYEVMLLRRDPYEKQADLLFPETSQETIFGESPAEYEEGLFDYSPGSEEAMRAPGEVRTTPSGMKYKVLK